MLGLWEIWKFGAKPRTFRKSAADGSALIVCRNTAMGYIYIEWGNRYSEDNCEHLSALGPLVQAEVRTYLILTLCWVSSLNAVVTKQLIFCPDSLFVLSLLHVCF